MASAGAKKGNQPAIDQEGAQALSLWDAREYERAAAEAARRYWDYWLRDPNRYWRMHNLWFRTDQLQKWLKDLDNYQPPPPPLSPYHGYFGPYYPYPPVGGGITEMPVSLGMYKDTPMELAIGDCICRAVIYVSNQTPRRYFRY